MTVTRVLGSGISRQCGVRALMSATKMIALAMAVRKREVRALVMLGYLVVRRSLGCSPYNIKISTGTIMVDIKIIIVIGISKLGSQFTKHTSQFSALYYSSTIHPCSKPRMRRNTSLNVITLVTAATRRISLI